MNLRSLWSSLREKPVSDALDYITKRINLVWSVDHDPLTGHHTTIFELGRSVALGAPVDVVFDPANFIGSATQTSADWPVVAANQLTLRYSLSGDVMHFAFRITGTNVANAPGQLWIRLPAGYVSTKRVLNTCVVSNAGAANAAGRVLVDEFTSGPTVGTVVQILLMPGGAWTNTGANDTTVEGELFFWVRKL